LFLFFTQQYGGIICIAKKMREMMGEKMHGVCSGDEDYGDMCSNMRVVMGILMDRKRWIYGE
jgi:hypothetical protein